MGQFKAELVAIFQRNIMVNFLDKLCSKKANFRPRIWPNYGGICGIFCEKIEAHIVGGLHGKPFGQVEAQIIYKKCII